MASTQAPAAARAQRTRWLTAGTAQNARRRSSAASRMLAAAAARGAARMACALTPLMPKALVPAQRRPVTLTAPATSTAV